MPVSPAQRPSLFRSPAPWIAITLTIGAAACAVNAAASPSARSAVLFIGDGMGPGYVTLTRVARGGSAGRLRMDSLPYTALARTHSSDSPVTDSAAAASAMACGQKTANGVLCEDSTAVYAKQDGRRLESVAVWAKKRGLLVGLVTTTRVTHATPAAFYATQRDRDDEADIARQAVASNFDFILGGGRRHFPDGLAAESRTRGWRIVETAEELQAIRGLDLHTLGLFASSHLPYQAEIEAARKKAAAGGPLQAPPGAPGGGQDAGDAARTSPTLPEMTRWAIDILKRSSRPFFLMVEGGRIDHAGHANWARTLVDETAAFDEAVGYAIDHLDPRTVLVLVTADHETGGLAMNGYPDEKDGIWSTYRDPEGSKGDEAYPVVSFMTGPGTTRQTEKPPHGDDDPHASGIPLTQAAHTGVDVTLYAWGAGAAKVHGTVENTAIYSILKQRLERRSSGR